MICRYQQHLVQNMTASIEELYSFMDRYPVVVLASLLSLGQQVVNGYVVLGAGEGD